MGAMTGRAAGYCAGNAVPGYANTGWGRGGAGLGRAFGRGLGLGFRGGRGRGAVAYAPPYAMPASEQEHAAVQDQVACLLDALEGIRKRIDDLESAKPAAQG